MTYPTCTMKLFLAIYVVFQIFLSILKFEHMDCLINHFNTLCQCILQLKSVVDTWNKAPDTGIAKHLQSRKA